MDKKKWWYKMAFWNKKESEHLQLGHLRGVISLVEEMIQKIDDEFELKANTFLFKHTKYPKVDPIRGLSPKNRERYWKFFDEAREMIAPLEKSIIEMVDYLKSKNYV